MSTTPTTPRFQRTTQRDHRLDLAAPLPSTLAALVPDRSEQHEKVASKVGDLRGRRIELARQLAEQEAADQRAAADAAAAGRSPGRRQKAASIRKRLEETETKLAGFEEGVGKSADSLLAAAKPLAAQGVEKANERYEGALGRGKELLAAADAAFAEAETLKSERAWLLRLLDGRQRIEPFRPGSGDPALRQLRAAVTAALADWQAEDERLRADFDRRRAVAAEQEAERLRHEERYRREDAARRVVTQGGVVVEQGGRPVRQTGFGLQPTDDEEEDA